MTISHCYGNVVVNNGNFTLLLISSGQEWQFLKLLMTSSGQERQLHIVTGMLVVNNGNFTLLLTASGQQWQFYIATNM